MTSKKLKSDRPFAATDWGFIVSLVAGLIGAALGGLVTHLSTVSLAKQADSYQLVQHFFSIEMTKIRQEASSGLNELINIASYSNRSDSNFFTVDQLVHDDTSRQNLENTIECLSRNNPSKNQRIILKLQHDLNKPIVFSNYPGELCKRLSRDRSEELRIMLILFNSIWRDILFGRVDEYIIKKHLSNEFDKWFNCYLRVYIDDSKEELNEWEEVKRSIIMLRGLVDNPTTPDQFIERGFRCNVEDNATAIP